MTDTALHTPIVMTDPEPDMRDRHLSLFWLLEEWEGWEHENEEREQFRGEWGTWRLQVELDVQHEGKPDYGVRRPYSFSATLRRRKRFYHGNFVRETFGVGGPAAKGSPNFPSIEGVVLVATLEGVRRFSRPKLQEFADKTVVELRRRRDDDELQIMFGGR